MKWKIPDKQFVSFKLHAIPGNMMKFCAIPLCPTRNVNHLFVECIYAVYATCLLLCSEKHSVYWVWYHMKFQTFTGDLGTYPLQGRGDYWDWSRATTISSISTRTLLLKLSVHSLLLPPLELCYLNRNTGVHIHLLLPSVPLETNRQEHVFFLPPIFQSPTRPFCWQNKKTAW